MAEMNCFTPKKLYSTINVSNEMLKDHVATSDGNDCRTDFPDLIPLDDFSGDKVRFTMGSRLVPCFVHTRWSDLCDPSTRFSAEMGQLLRSALAAGNYITVGDLIRTEIERNYRPFPARLDGSYYPRFDDSQKGIQ